MKKFFSRFKEKRLWLLIFSVILITSLINKRFVSIVQIADGRWDEMINLIMVIMITAPTFYLLIRKIDKYYIEKLEVQHKAFRESEEHYRHLLETAPLPMAIQSEGKFVYINQAGLKVLGAKSLEELLGHSTFEFIPIDYHQTVKNRMKHALEGIRLNPIEYPVIRLDGKKIYLELAMKKTNYRDKPAFMIIGMDITERKNMEKQLHHMAYHDGLTGLPNRYKLTQCFETVMSNKTMKHAAILFIDLDRFKLMNDTFGHDYGDVLLKQVAERLKGIIRTGDILARQGGDEFLLFLPRIDEEGASKMARSILDRFNEPIVLNDYEIYITPSIGISLYPQDGAEIGALLKKADSALHQVKAFGKNNYRFYIHNPSEKSPEILEMDLRKAIEREEFLLHYQPKLNIQSGKMIGVEALIRWQHPNKGFISPAQFIPLAEETGLIIPIGEWVLRKVCTQNKSWQEKGFPPTVVSVNLSLRQFYQPNLVQRVSQILYDTGLAPEQLELEITESMMIDSRHALKIVKELKKLGVKISLDDFGTGYSSLHYLKEFPIDTLKIDQSFVRDCLTDGNDATIIKTIIAMAHQLKKEVVAEGIECKEQLIFLQQNLCNEGQGYLFSKPVPLETLEEKYQEIEQLVGRLGIPSETRDQTWLEEALRVAQQELQDTVRQQQGITYKFKKQDEKFIHTLCDGELLYRMGFTSEQILGRELHEFIPIEIAEEILKSYQRAWNGEHDVSYEGEFNGIHYLASLRPIRRGGQVVEVIGSCADITERKRMEESLRLSEARYRLIAENMSDVIKVLDVNAFFQYASPSHETIFGLLPEELEGTMIYHLIHPEDQPHVEEKLTEIILSRKPIQIEYRHKHAHVHDYWIHVEAQGTPVLGKDGEIEHIVIVARDITERKQAEELLRKADRLSVVAELAAGVAHEIRNPLTSIKGFVQLMKLGMSQPEYFDIMLDEFQRLEGIIHEFLMLAKPQMIQLKPTNLLSLLEHVMKWSETQANIHNIRVQYEFEENILPIWCDEDKLKQVFINLLQNAMESMPDGGEIVLQVNQCDGNRVSILIADHGCGIPEERMKSLGEPFYSTKEKGIGLGLMISFRIIEEHKGTIQFESEVDKGTTVEVILPLTLEEKEGIL